MDEVLGSMLTGVAFRCWNFFLLFTCVYSKASGAIVAILCVCIVRVTYINTSDKSTSTSLLVTDSWKINSMYNLRTSEIVIGLLIVQIIYNISVSFFFDTKQCMRMLRFVLMSFYHSLVSQITIGLTVHLTG